MLVIIQSLWLSGLFHWIVFIHWFIHQLICVFFHSKKQVPVKFRLYYFCQFLFEDPILSRVLSFKIQHLFSVVNNHCVLFCSPAPPRVSCCPWARIVHSTSHILKIGFSANLLSRIRKRRRINLHWLLLWPRYCAWCFIIGY